MILLDPASHAVEEVLNSWFDNVKIDPNVKVKLEHKIADFDSSVYHLKDGGDKSSILVSIHLNCFKELEAHNVHEYLRKHYGTMLLDQPEAGYNVTLSVDLNNLPEDHESLARKCALLKRHCLASVFVKYFDQVVATANAKPTKPSAGSKDCAVIHVRPNGTIYIQALQDRVTVIYSIMFKDPDDIVIGKQFLQELTQPYKHIDRAPQVHYCQNNPPSELQGTDAAVGDSMAYVTFSLSPRHVAEGSVREKTIDLLSLFSTYFQYHIKCAKSYVQMRMRAKTSEFIKVVNRARPENPTLPVISLFAKH